LTARRFILFYRIYNVLDMLEVPVREFVTPWERAC